MRALVLILLSLTGACAGAKAHIVHDELRYPVSMSGALPDAEGNLHVLGHGLEAVGKLDLRWSAIGIGYGSQTKTVDISESINKRVDALKGDGVVQLELSVSSCALNFFFPLNILPFWPGCADVRARGTVIRAKNVASPDIPAVTGAS